MEVTKFVFVYWHFVQLLVDIYTIHRIHNTANFYPVQEAQLPQR